jgi:NifU-like protein involved in Fe-S cluster formation
MNAPLYTTEILRLAASLEPPRVLDQVDGRAELRSPTCGSRVETEVQLDAGGRIAGLSQQVHACAFGQASASLTERGAIGHSRAEVAQALSELGYWLDGGGPDPGWGLAALAPARSRKSRHGAILLPLRALLAAIDASHG